MINSNSDNVTTIRNTPHMDNVMIEKIDLIDVLEKSTLATKKIRAQLEQVLSQNFVYNTDVASLPDEVEIAQKSEQELFLILNLM